MPKKDFLNTINLLNRSEFDKISKLIKLNTSDDELDFNF
jgi:hypothetical protein